MYCFRVGHRLSTLKHMGCFIRELDVCVRWQVAWQGRRKESDTGGILCMLFAWRCIFADKHIHLGWVDCLATRGGKSAGTSYIFPDENAFTTRLLCCRTNYFIGSNNSPRHSHHFSSHLVVLHLPVHTNTALWQKKNKKKTTASVSVSWQPVWQYARRKITLNT